MSVVFLALSISSGTLIINAQSIIRLIIIITATMLLCKNNIWNGLYLLSFPFIVEIAFTNVIATILISAFIFIFIFTIAIFNMLNGKFRIIYSATIIAAIVIMLLTVKVPYSLSIGLMNNFSTKNMETDYYFWPEDIREKISYDIIPQMARNRELAKYTVAKECNIGNGTFIDINSDAFRIALASLNNRKKDSIITFAANTGQYLLAPLTFLDNCEGYGDSITAKRISIFTEKHAAFNMLYVKLSMAFVLIWIAATVSDMINKKAFKTLVFTTIFWIIWSMLCGMFANTAFDILLFIPIFVVIIKNSLKREDAR